MSKKLVLPKEPVLPLYLLIQSINILDDVPKDYSPGRIIVDLAFTQMYINLYPDRLLEKLGPNDCLWIPFYRGCSLIRKDRGGNNGLTKEEKVPYFKRNIEFALEASKIIKKVVVGNAGIESWIFDKNIRRISGHVIARFIRETAIELRDFGLEPMYVYAEMHKDCYEDNWIVRDVLLELDLVQFTPMIWNALVEKWAVNEELPYPKLREYLSKGHFWGGVNYAEGLKNGNDELLKFLGFEAGVIGKVHELLQEE